MNLKFQNIYVEMPNLSFASIGSLMTGFDIVIVSYNI